MSYSTLHIVDDDGDICDDSQYANSWGFAAMIWSALVKKYAAQIPGIDPADRYLTSNFDNWPRLWKATDALPLEPWERDVLVATYDRAMVRGADLVRMAESMEAFQATHAEQNRVCTLNAIAARLRDLAAGEKTKITAPDVCFTATSVAEDLWYVPADDPDEEGRPYNVKKDTGHWFVDLTPVAPGFAARRAGGRR